MTAPSRHGTAWGTCRQSRKTRSDGIRRIDLRSGTASPWAHVTMVVPSRGRSAGW